MPTISTHHSGQDCIVKTKLTNREPNRFQLYILESKTSNFFLSATMKGNTSKTKIAFEICLSKNHVAQSNC
jgi:hypothetical protein